MGRFGDYEVEEAASLYQRKPTCNIFILPKSVEISDEAWDKTLEKASGISEFCQSIIPSYLTLDLKPKVKNVDADLAEYLKELNLKNQTLLRDTKESIEKLYAIENRKKDELEKKKEDLERKREEKAQSKESLEINHPQKITESVNVEIIPQVKTAPENPKITASVTDIKEKQNYKESLHHIQGKVVSLTAYQEADRCIQVVTGVKKLKKTLNSNSLFKGKMSIRTRCGQFMNLQAKVIEIVGFSFLILGKTY